MIDTIHDQVGFTTGGSPSAERRQAWPDGNPS